MRCAALICGLIPLGLQAPDGARDQAPDGVQRATAKSVGAEPPKWSLEEQKVVAVAQEYLKKTKKAWETPIEVKRPPNRVNVPDWKKYVEEEKNIWKVVYETPEKERRRLGARTLFVNMRTNEVTPSVRK